MNFNRKLVYAPGDYYLVFSVEGEGEDRVLVISCEDAPGLSVGETIELNEGYELEELRMALEGCEVFTAGPLTVDQGRISWLLPSGEKEVFALTRGQYNELEASLEYLVPIFALGVEA